MRDLEGCEVHVIVLRPRPRPRAARRLAGEHQAGPQVGLPALPRTASSSGSPWFYRAFDLPTVLTSWSVGVPPERVHLVTVPQRRRRPGRAVPPVLHGVRHRPRVGAARQRPAQHLARRRRDPGDPTAQPADGPGHPPRDGVRRADPRAARPGPSRAPRVAAGPAAARAASRGPTSRPTVDRVGQGQRHPRRRRPRRPAPGPARRRGALRQPRQGAAPRGARPPPSTPSPR